MNKILGLDLGTNSIGWALIEQDYENKNGEIIGMGSRIIPMSQDVFDDFGSGKPSKTQTAERTNFRGIRRLRERFLLRRERLHRVLNVLGFLPEHYAAQIDFEKHLGKFKEESEPKLAYQAVRNNDKGKNEYRFIFKKSFDEMLCDFRAYQPELLENSRKIPYDWTIYYLRKKALTKKIEKEELTWILLNFNQKRGYYQLRGEEEEENSNKQIEFYSLKVVDVLADEQLKGKTDIWYSIILENDWVYRRASKTPLFDWKDKVRDFIVTTELNDDGTIKTDKQGKEKRNFRAPGDDDWTLLKKKTEAEIDKANKTVGEYIYDALLQNPKQKIIGKLVRTIERKFYKDELNKILQKQKEFHPELDYQDLYNDCVRELYRNNEAHQFSLIKRNIIHLFINDIIFYQRPLKSQKSLIGKCSLEYKKYNVNGEEKTEYLKAIPKSHPLYQEFRLWKWIDNLSIYKKDDDSNATGEFLESVESYDKLFEFLNKRKDIEQKPLIKYFLELKGLKGKTLSAELEKYRWNFVEDKKYPCNETKTFISTRLKNVENVDSDFLTSEIEQKLWHIIYSVTDKEAYEKALITFAKKHQLDVSSFAEAFNKFPPFDSEYGSYSEKAIKKLLPLMRLGKYWSWDTIDKTTKDRIGKLVSGEFDEEIKIRVREKTKKEKLEVETDFQGLPEWLAKYIIYDKHSEADIAGKWNSVADMENYLKEFKQHSLRNPIVEQVLTETIRVVKDIWQKYGNGAKDFFDEIHIELGREMKKTKEEREYDTKRITENENTNLRIKALLAELKNDPGVENVRPYSPLQHEILKIYEDGVLSSNVELNDDILEISKTAQPSSTEIKRYKLWLEQKYRSPYTGNVIPLNKLFTLEYEIEHIIPQSRYFDDSFSNKVICETAVNKLKGNKLGLEFIKNHPGEIVETGSDKKVKVFTEAEYKDFVMQRYEKNRSKRSKLLMEDIPEKMIERQLNDTRYISKFVSSVLSNIVRSEQNDDGVNSKNLLPGNGKITAALKQDWGLNDVWNDLILPRFERLNQLTKSTAFTTYNERYQKYLPTVPLELSKNFQRKRIDHRHHALDALIIACATREHINYLNNQHALDKTKNKIEKQKFRYDLRAILCNKKYNDGSDDNYNWVFKKPWNNFTVDSKNALETIVISFKQNVRVINKATNKYESYKDENGDLRIGKDGKPVKGIIAQTKGDNWAIRKPMHKETVSGKVELKRIKVPKGKILTATRKSIDATFDLNTIESITDTGIQKILKNYLLSKDDDPELAFSPEGIEDMNKNIEKYNDGKPHQPIHKVRFFEVGNKFPLGQTGNKKDKYVETAKGTNLFFAIYQDDYEKRSFETIPFNVVIERQKQGLDSVPEKNDNEDRLLFHLSPNDLVYVPDEEELVNKSPINFSSLSKVQKKRLYNVNDFSSTCYFTPNCIAQSISSKEVDLHYDKQKNKITGSYDTKTASINGKQIKDVCIKLKVDRLGNISKAKI